jgi:hypothetical protein
MSSDTKPYRTFKVVWEIEVDAANPKDAAKIARVIQLDHQSVATVFTVKDLKSRKREVVDLMKHREN